MNISSIKAQNELVKKYEPLVNKITKQFSNSIKTPWNDIKSMAYEGLVIAFNTYDEERSDMTFVQFAAFAIRNNILTSLDNELRTVKMSNYAQKKAAEAGLESAFTSVSMTKVSGEKGDEHNEVSREYKYGLYEGPKWEYGNVLEYLFMRLEEKFSERDCQMFYMSFGLNGCDDIKGKDIAKHFGVSEGLVSQKVKKIISFIRKDNDLCEVLQNL